MNRIVRGRITDGRWTDEEVIWEADIESYSITFRQKTSQQSNPPITN